MERRGPEALMVQARVVPRTDLADYARLEYAYEDVRVIAAKLQEAADPRPGERSAVGGLILRAHAWLSGRADRGAEVPVVREESRAVGAPAALWAIPMLEEGARDGSR